MLTLTIILCCIALSTSYPSSKSLDYNDIITNEIETDLEAQALSDYLMHLLSSPPGTELPLVLVRDEVDSEGPNIEKRSRYYRRYPWKRQNGRSYDPDGYLCAPTREDVFQLLVALHEARSGRTDRTVSFCNRRRPARAVLTSVRFLG